MRLMFLFIVLFLRFAISGDVWIKKVEGPNRLVLSDGHTVRMANIETPSLNDPDSAQRAVAKIIRSYIKRKVVKERDIQVVFTKFNSRDSLPLVYLIMNYPLEKKNLNLYFLRQGYGKFVDNAGSKYKEQALQAQREAQKNLLGIWNPHPFRKFKRPYLLMVSGTYYDNFNKDDRDVFQGAWFSFRPQGQRHGLLFAGGIARHRESGTGCCECDWPEGPPDPLPTYNHISIPYYLQIGGQFAWQYVGLDVGLSYFHLGDLYCGEAPPYWILPFARLKLGVMEKLFVTANVLDNFFLPFSSGIKYYYRYPDTWLALSGWKEKSGDFSLGIQAGFPFLKQFHLNVQTVYKTGRSELGISIGIGKVVFIKH